MADTTSLNTGIHSGIFRRLEIIFKRTYETDILALECLFHINELLFGKVIKYFDGETASPTSLEGGCVQNRINHICPSTLNLEHLKAHETINIKPRESVQEFLSTVLEWVQSKPTSSKAIRVVQPSMLVLAGTS